MVIRDKNNKKIDIKIRKDIKNVMFEDILKFTKNRKVVNLAISKFCNFKYFFDYERENTELLYELEVAIQKFELKKLIDLCDGYSNRFFDAYEYLYKKIKIKEENYKYYYKLFFDLFKNGKTSNSINLATYFINLINKNLAKEICDNILKDNLDYIEISSFVLKNSRNCDYNTTFNMFVNSYVEKNTFEYLNNLNMSKQRDFKDFIMSFYLYDVLNICLSKLDDFELTIFFTYMFNLKNASDYLSSKFMFDDLFSQLKYLVKDVKELFEKVENVIDFKTLNYEELDYKVFRFYIRFFKDFKKYIDNRVLKNIFEDFIKAIEKDNYNEGKQIVRIYNELDVDITEELFEKLYYDDSMELCKAILRICREYKYFGNVIKNIERKFYITELIENEDFRRILFRSLYIFYDSLNFEVVGTVFLKAVMEKKELYYENKYYINTILEEILERVGN